MQTSTAPHLTLGNPEGCTIQRLTITKQDPARSSEEIIVRRLLVGNTVQTFPYLLPHSFLPILLTHTLGTLSKVATPLHQVKMKIKIAQFKSDFDPFY